MDGWPCVGGARFRDHQKRLALRTLVATNLPAGKWPRLASFTFWHDDSDFDWAAADQELWEVEAAARQAVCEAGESAGQPSKPGAVPVDVGLLAAIDILDPYAMETLRIARDESLGDVRERLTALCDYDRKYAGYSKTELATLVGCTPQRVGQILAKLKK